MPNERLIRERDLAGWAKRFRKKAGVTRAQAARDMGVAQTSIFHAEESPQQSFVKLRTRMIEKYSPFKVVGAVYFLKRKR
jgi:DNA-binding XRE family transcriptional regulator